MNAHVIISEEYKHNLPAVFLFFDGQYFGDKVYPMIRDYPSDVNYWKNSTSSDSDRGFNVYDVDINDVDFEAIRNIEDAIRENLSRLQFNPAYEGAPVFKKRKGEDYDKFLEWFRAWKTESDRVDTHNFPIESELRNLKYEVRSILLSLI